MLRSLNTAISGLNAHQQMLDVTANNIANVNTSGFKSSSTQFEDTLSQTMSAGAVTSNQVGLGVRVTGTAMDFATGSQQPTGVPSNLMINGDGFFVLDKNGSQTYTRNGAFTLDNGQLKTSDGAIVKDVNGSDLDLTALSDGTYVSYSIDASGTVQGVASDGSTTALGQIGIATFPNPEGLTKVGDTQYIASNISGTADIGAASTGSKGSVLSGYVEGSNVDLSQELTNLIVAQRGFQANSKVVTTSDEVLQTLVNLKN